MAFNHPNDEIDLVHESRTVRDLVTWFLAHYEPPEESVSRDDGEWFWGDRGPHRAEDVLDGRGTEAEVRRAVELLEVDTFEWARII